MKEIVEVTDKTVIERIEFKYPEIMSADAEKQIREEYAYILELENNIQDLREKIREYESTLETKRKEFSEKTKICEITFAVKKKEWERDDFYSSFGETGDAIQRIINR